jgi:excisionase family DNA binding protein
MVSRLGKGNEKKIMNTNKNGWGASLAAPGSERLISKREAAEILGVSVRTVEREISAGNLPVQRIRGCVRLWLSRVLLHAGIESNLASSQS